MNVVQIKIWKEAVESYLKVFFQTLGQPRTILVSIAGNVAKIRN
jgi:hypothetical protein